MSSSNKSVQIVVFIMAGVIVVAFVISAYHYVRALHAQQQAEIRLQASRRRDLHGARILREALWPQMHEASGVIIQQPDDSEEIAIKIKPDAVCQAHQENELLIIVNGKSRQP